MNSRCLPRREKPSFQYKKVQDRGSTRLEIDGAVIIHDLGVTLSRGFGRADAQGFVFEPFLSHLNFE